MGTPGEKVVPFASVFAVSISQALAQGSGAYPTKPIKLIVGFAIAVFQATTQIQEQTLSFAPKVVVVFGSLAIGGAWTGAQLMRFTFHVFDRFPYMLGK